MSSSLALISTSMTMMHVPGTTTTQAITKKTVHVPATTTTQAITNMMTHVPGMAMMHDLEMTGKMDVELELPHQVMEEIRIARFSKEVRKHHKIAKDDYIVNVEASDDTAVHFDPNFQVHPQFFDPLVRVPFQIFGNHNQYAIQYSNQYANHPNNHPSAFNQTSNHPTSHPAIQLRPTSMPTIQTTIHPHPTKLPII